MLLGKRVACQMIVKRGWGGGGERGGEKGGFACPAEKAAMGLEAEMHNLCNREADFPSSKSERKKSLRQDHRLIDRTGRSMRVKKLQTSSIGKPAKAGGHNPSSERRSKCTERGKSGANSRKVTSEKLTEKRNVNRSAETGRSSGLGRRLKRSTGKNWGG